jgi:hypothetical protein
MQTGAWRSLEMRTKSIVKENIPCILMSKDEEEKNKEDQERI